MTSNQDSSSQDIAEITEIAARIQPETAELHDMLQSGRPGSEIMSKLWPEAGH